MRRICKAVAADRPPGDRSDHRNSPARPPEPGGPTAARRPAEGVRSAHAHDRPASISVARRHCVAVTTWNGSHAADSRGRPPLAASARAAFFESYLTPEVASDGHEERLHAPDDVAGPPPRLLRQRQARSAAQQRPEGRGQLEAGQRRAEAEVDPGAERDVRVLGPGHVEPARRRGGDLLHPRTQPVDGPGRERLGDQRTEIGRPRARRGRRRWAASTRAWRSPSTTLTLSPTA
jgi:hypothetical protein